MIQLDLVLSLSVINAAGRDGIDEEVRHQCVDVSSMLAYDAFPIHRST